MNAQPQTRMTAEEYLAFERDAEERHELWDGELLAMAGTSLSHNRISWNLAVLLDPGLKKRGCEAFVNEMRVQISEAGRYVYPDIAVVCGEALVKDDDTLLNPTLVIEILSPSTEGHDRGRKLFGYRGLPSLQACLLVAQDQPWIQYWKRQDDGSWNVSDVSGLDATVDLPEISASLRLVDVYERVEFPE